MSTIQDIESAIRRLSHDDLAELRAWLADYNADRWDEQIAHDEQGGRLDTFYQKMKRESAAQPIVPLEDFLDQQKS